MLVTTQAKIDYDAIACVRGAATRCAENWSEDSAGGLAAIDTLHEAWGPEWTTTQAKIDCDKIDGGWWELDDSIALCVEDGKLGEGKTNSAGGKVSASIVLAAKRKGYFNSRFGGYPTRATHPEYGPIYVDKTGWKFVLRSSDHPGTKMYFDTDGTPWEYEELVNNSGSLAGYDDNRDGGDDPSQPCVVAAIECTLGTGKGNSKRPVKSGSSVDKANKASCIGNDNRDGGDDPSHAGAVAAIECTRGTSDGCGGNFDFASMVAIIVEALGEGDIARVQRLMVIVRRQRDQTEEQARMLLEAGHVPTALRDELAAIEAVFDTFEVQLNQLAGKQ